MTENNTPSCGLAFYNLIANLLFNNELHEENIAIRNVWQKGDANFLNVYFYSTKKSKVLESNYFHDIYDLSTEKYYKDINAFIEEFLETQKRHELQKQDTKDEKVEIRYTYLENFRPAVLILIFFSRLNPNLMNVKINVIKEYIKSKQPKAEKFSNQYIEAYIKSITPSIDDFYQSLEELKRYSSEDVEDMAREAVKISVTDGVVHYEEKIFLAELFQALREYGITPDIEF